MELALATKAIIEYERKILILRESTNYSDGTHFGKYDFPGGRIAAGETLTSALAREVKEETGLEIEAKEIFFANEDTATIHGKKLQIIRLFFRCEGASNKIKLSQDHDAYVWINPAQYQKYKIIPNLKPVFEEYVKQRRKQRWK